MVIGKVFYKTDVREHGSKNSGTTNALRVLAMGYKELNHVPSKEELADLEKDLIYIGMVGMIDPPREEAKQAVEKCKTAGIKTVMITGDHKITATAIAKSLGILENDDEAITGTELEEMSDEDLIKNIESFVSGNKTAFERLLNAELLKHYNIFEKELLRNISAKLVRMKDLEEKKGNLPEKDIYDNFECALKGSFYMFIRALCNKYDNSEYFYFIREYCYSSMFRYNSNGEFNVPYGGISYNRKNFQRKIDYIKSKELQSHFVNTDIYNLDFEEFLDKIKLTKNDFIFLDPPYDTDFSSYVNNTFDKQDQERLANYLINKCPAKFMLVIKNTEFISDLYIKSNNAWSNSCICRRSYRQLSFQYEIL